MMTYIYFCPKCNKTIDIVKSVKDSGNEEKCICGTIMRKIFNVGWIKTGDGVKNYGKTHFAFLG